ncbi:hypothetical protein F4860DRAFT_459729 [Xylaria cubensis]|nr:hypothetical protein F4860DRAFT_459729 [Xylaria cubensis]
MLTSKRSMVDAPNKVPQHQRFYQQAYKQHTRLWQIVRPTTRPVPSSLSTARSPSRELSD